MEKVFARRRAGNMMEISIGSRCGDGRRVMTQLVGTRSMIDLGPCRLSSLIIVPPEENRGCREYPRTMRHSGK